MYNIYIYIYIYIIRLIKLKSYFKDSNIYNPTTEDEFFRTKTNKKWQSDKNQHNIETPTEVTKNVLEKEGQTAVKRNFTTI